MEDPFNFIAQFLSDSPDDCKINKVIRIVEEYVENRDLRDFSVSICEILDLTEESNYDKLQSEFKTYCTQILSSSKAAQLAEEQIIHYQAELRMAELNNENLEDESLVIEKQNKRFVSCLQGYYEKFNLEQNFSDDIESQLDFLILSECSNLVENSQKLEACEITIEELKETLQHEESNHTLLQTEFQMQKENYLEQLQLLAKEKSTTRTIIEHSGSESEIEQFKETVKELFTQFWDTLLSFDKPLSEFCSLAIEWEPRRDSVVSNEIPIQLTKMIKETETYVEVRNVGIEIEKDETTFTEQAIELEYVTTMSEYVEATKPPLVSNSSRGKTNVETSQPTNKEVLTDQLLTVDSMIEHNSEMQDFNSFVYFKDLPREVKTINIGIEIQVYGDDKATGTILEISSNDKAIQSTSNEFLKSKFREESLVDSELSIYSSYTQKGYLTVLEEENKEYKEELISLSIHLKVLENELKMNTE